MPKQKISPSVISNIETVLITGPKGDMGLQGPKGDIGGTFTTFNIIGDVTVNNGTIKQFPPTNITLNTISSFISIPPIGSSIILNVLKNGVSILNSNFLTINNGNSVSNVININTNMIITDYLTVNVLNVGTSVAGSNLSIRIFYNVI